MSVIEHKALQLKNIEKEALKNFSEKNYIELLNNVEEFREIKDEIKKYILENPILNIDDKEAIKIILKINNGEDLPLEKAFKDSWIGVNLKEELFFEPELTEIGSDVFYSWFSHYEYIKGLLEIGSLMLLGGRVPNGLGRFADEARSAYTFQLYHAAVSICRTLIEVSVKELCINNGILPRDTRKLKRLDSRKISLANLISDLCYIDGYSKFYERLKSINRKTSFVIHGNQRVTKSEAYQVLKETFSLVQDIYSH